MIPSTIDDATLLSRWQAGDREAGGLIFDRHHEAIIRFFRNKVDDAFRDDLIQQTFVAAQTANFAGKSALRTWLIAIAWRRLANFLRGEARRTKREERAFGTESIATMGQSPESYFVMEQERRLLLEGLRRIPLNHQVVLELHYWEEMTGQEISNALEIPLGTIKTRLRDGRLHLNKVLAEIADSVEVLRSTVDNLEKWAKRSKVNLTS